jgi:competence protein ComEC
MHLTTVAGCVMLCARPWPRWESALLVLAVTAYAAMVGDVESLSRAYLMMLIMVTMRGALRPVRGIDALGTTWFVMSVADPLSLRSVGLQLSFAATFAVLVCLPLVHARPQPGRSLLARWARGSVKSLAAAFVLSVAVELFIAPLQLHHFHALSAVGPVATVLFLFPVTLILLGSAPVAVLGALAPAAEWPGSLLGAVSTLTSEAVVACGRLAPSVLALPEPRPWLYYGALALAWRFRRRRPAWLLAAAMLALSFV